MNISFIVDGAAVEAEGGATFERKDPMTGKVATRAAAATVGRRREGRGGGGEGFRDLVARPGRPRGARCC